MNLGTQTVTVLTASTTEDEYHNTVQDWSAPARSDIRGCSVQPGGGSEDTVDRDAITTLWTVFAPLAPLDSTNRVEYAGTAYDIDGPVDRWEVGTPLDHMVIRLKAVAG